MQWLIYTGVIAILKNSNIRNTKKCLFDSFFKKLYILCEKTRNLGSWLNNNWSKEKSYLNQDHTETY